MEVIRQEMRHIPSDSGCSGDSPNGGLGWRAPKARARLRIPDSIRGLAQAVARPAYRRLITAEPFLRRAVPVLIIAFLLTLGIAAFVDVRERLRQAIIKSAEELDLVATVLAERIDRLALE